MKNVKSVCYTFTSQELNKIKNIEEYNENTIIKNIFIVNNGDDTSEQGIISIIDKKSGISYDLTSTPNYIKPNERMVVCKKALPLQKDEIIGIKASSSNIEISIMTIEED